MDNELSGVYPSHMEGTPDTRLHPTEEEFFMAQFKCNCGNSFDSHVALAYHKATAHLNAK